MAGNIRSANGTINSDIIQNITAANFLHTTLRTTNNSLVQPNTTTFVVNEGPGELSNEFLTFVKITCVFIFLLGLIGNTLVLIVFGSRWSALKNCEVFMMSLAVADLIATVVVPVRMFLELIEHNFYEIGDFGCKLLSVFSMTTVTVTALTLLVIAIDRYLIVKFPLRNPPDTWKLGAIVLLTWFLSVCLSAIYLVGDRIRLSDKAGKQICGSFMKDHETHLHTIIVFCIQIIIPLFSMTVLYSLIVIELRKSANSKLLSYQERDIRIRLRRNRRATILFVTIVACHYVFVLPNSIFFMVYTFGTVELGNSLNTVYTLLLMILMMNSCVNPIIYSNLHASFRRMTLRLFCSCIVTKFKSYEWGEGMISMVRNSTRSLRSSIRSSRAVMLLSNRSKSFEDENHNSNNRNRRESRRKSSSSYSSTQMTKDRSEFDPYAMREVRFTEDDDVFETTSQNGGQRKKMLRSQTIESAVSDSSNESPRFNSRQKRKSSDADKRRKLLKQQNTIDEEL